MKQRAVDKYATVKIPGCHVPRFILRVLKRIYPEVRIVWNYHYQRWQLVEIDKFGRMSDIALIHNNGKYATPTMENTVGFLQQVDSLQHMATKWDLDRFLERLDSERENARSAASTRAVERVMPAGEALYDLLIGKVSVAMPSKTRNGKVKTWPRR